MRKGDLAWETVVKLLIAVIFLLFMTILVYAMRDKLFALVAKMAEFLRVG